MNIAEFRKAIAGGFAGAVMGLGGQGSIAVTLPAGSPGWEQYLLVALVGFIIGFVAVYVPPNAPKAKP